jgi:hypothetical protein
MTSPISLGKDLFAGGPPLKLQAWLGIAKPTAPEVVRRSIFVVLIGWVPLAVLAAVQTLVQHGAGLHSFLSDFAVHARFLVAIPLLIAANANLVPRLGGIARQFLDAGLVPETDYGRFAAAAATTRRLRDSIWAEVMVVVVAYAIVGVLIYAFPTDQLPVWHRAGAGDIGSYSFAGWWHALVSIPLLLVFFLGSMWRLFLWARFLWVMSRLDLQLVPAHPDRAAGLKFVGTSARAFSLHGMAMGLIVAGRMANAVINEGQPLLSFKYVAAGVAAFTVAVIGAPLLFFGGRLLSARRRGGYEYGGLASAVGRQFERKWMGRAEPVGDEALGAQDFSATTDLYQVVANIYALRFFPVDFQSMQLLVGATLLPFLLVAFIALPFEEIVSWLGGLLF